MTTQPRTTQPLTTQPLTTQPLTTQPLTTKPLTTQELTTQPLSTKPLTTQPLTTMPLTTKPLTTQPFTTKLITTKPLTTSPLTTGLVPPQAANLCGNGANLLNGDFELYSGCTANTYCTYYAGSNLGGWIVGGNNVELDGSSIWAPVSGSFSLELNGNNPGSITQTVNVTPYTNYVLSFYLRDHPGWTTSTMSVTIGGTVYPFSASGGWLVQKIYFLNYAPTSLTITFAATNSGGAGCVIDSIRLASVDSIISNPSFETNSCSGSYCLVGPWSTSPISGWNLVNDGLYIVPSSLVNSVSGSWSLYFGYGTAILNQTLTVVPSQSYELSFYLAAPPVDPISGYNCAGRTTFMTIRIGLNSYQYNVSFLGADNQHLQWQYARIPFVSTSSSVIISFIQGNGVCGPLLDDIAITCVPGACGKALSLQNSDFETSPCSAYGWCTYPSGTNLGGWIVGGDTVEIDGSGGTWPSVSGSFSMELNGNGPGSITQSVTVAPYTNYALYFYLRNHPGMSTTSTMSVTIGGTSYPFSTNSGWMVQKIAFYNYLSTSLGVTFAATSGGSGGCVIDSARLVSVDTLILNPGFETNTCTTSYCIVGSFSSSIIQWNIIYDGLYNPYIVSSSLFNTVSGSWSFYFGRAGSSFLNQTLSLTSATRTN
eukprot:TRINITY_DN6830_c0_g1_i1.p1 TRINITY_DN6830_c0_g1~~TRINITY_DN6830_c0_g1_i1.p1  ORF type:complete len:713 (+),score=123.76 TRINITY_DN6830_c0_g1_i1:184-2139(+)